MKSKKRKINLGKLFYVVYLEYCALEYTDKSELQSKELVQFAYKRKEAKDAIEELAQRFKRMLPYKMRLTYSYSRKKRRWHMRIVKRKSTPFFYLKGEIKPKQELIGRFKETKPEFAERIESYSSPMMFCVDDIVEPVSKYSNYDMLQTQKV